MLEINESHSHVRQLWNDIRKLKTNICAQEQQINVNRLIQKVEAFSSTSEIACVREEGRIFYSYLLKYTQLWKWKETK